MKPIPLFRFLMFIMAFMVAVFYLNFSREHNLKGEHEIKTGVEANAAIPSSNDFILFESISKYLFISHIK